MNPVPKLSNRTRHRIRTNFDAAADNRHTNNHFADASNIDINSAIWADRNVVRNRCKYELRNNPIAFGMVEDYANEVIGTGPTLQVLTDNSRFNTEVERAFAAWWAHCDAGERFDGPTLLRIGLHEQAQSGEDILCFTRAQRAKQNEVALRLMAISPERLDDDYMLGPDGRLVDGIKIDEATGRPLAYNILNSHPGSQLGAYDLRSKLIPARDIIHTFHAREAGQYRGTPLLQPALTLLADLRRYTKAVIAAAEQAANISAVIYTQLGQIDPDQIAAMDEIEIARNALLTLPQGWEAKQFDAKQPTGTYAEFKAEVVNEIGRCLTMPYIVAAGNAQGYNYASGRLDLQTWWRLVDIIRRAQEHAKLARIYQRWFQEAAMVGSFRHFTAKLRRQYGMAIPIAWNWPGHYHVDPAKEAAAQKQRLENRTTTLAREYAAAGQDWETELEQYYRERARAVELAKQYGVPAGPVSAAAPAVGSNQEDDNDDES